MISRKELLDPKLPYKKILHHSLVVFGIAYYFAGEVTVGKHLFIGVFLIALAFGCLYALIACSNK